jgi:hypothetical protein
MALCLCCCCCLSLSRASRSDMAGHACCGGYARPYVLYEGRHPLIDELYGAHTRPSVRVAAGCWQRHRPNAEPTRRMHGVRCETRAAASTHTPMRCLARTTRLISAAHPTSLQRGWRCLHPTYAAAVRGDSRVVGGWRGPDCVQRVRDHRCRSRRVLRVQALRRLRLRAEVCPTARRQSGWSGALF